MKKLIVLFVAAVLAAGCHHKPPPAAPPPPVVMPPPSPPPPPPPPPCEAISEGCTGQNGTLARIRKSGLSIAVPNGWTFAQQADATVISSNNSAMLVVSTFDMGAASEASREGALAALVNLLGVTAPRHKIAWTHPSKKARVGALELSFWQADDVTKGLKKGPMLLFGAELPDKTWLLGAGFVADDDKSDADQAILGAVQSIVPTPPTPPPPAASP